MSAECEHEGCRGTATSTGSCLGHLDEASFEHALRLLQAQNSGVDARGAQIASCRLDALLRSLVSPANRVLQQAVDLRGATIEGNVSLARLRLSYPLRFAGAEIRGALTISALGGLGHLALGTPTERLSVTAVQVSDCKDDTEIWDVAGLDVANDVEITDVRVIGGEALFLLRTDAYPAPTGEDCD